MLYEVSPEGTGAIPLIPRPEVLRGYPIAENREWKQLDSLIQDKKGDGKE